MDHLPPLVSPKLDPLQFVPTRHQSLNAVIHLLHRSLSLLESSGDFVSTLLKGKLEEVGVDCHLVAWVINYLTSRPK